MGMTLFQFRGGTWTQEKVCFCLLRLEIQSISTFTSNREVEKIKLIRQERQEIPEESSLIR